MAEPLSPLNYIVPEYLPEGLTILDAKQKTGKSWLGYALAIAKASGGGVLGKQVKKGPALYLALEDGKRRLKARAECMLGSAPIPENLTLATS
jgi:RecA-family ATPase